MSDVQDDGIDPVKRFGVTIKDGIDDGTAGRDPVKLLKETSIPASVVNPAREGIVPINWQPKSSTKIKEVP